jgi:hypothetical protein
MDDNKAEALSRQVTELEKRLGSEYFALVNDLNKRRSKLARRSGHRIHTRTARRLL